MSTLPQPAAELAVAPQHGQAASVERRVEALEHELKFAVHEARVPIVRRWLNSVCRPDPTYPSALVWSIYYDTATWRALYEKLNSEYLKTKLRLRWYSSLDGVALGSSFAEAKFRVGGRREKVRARTSWAGSWLATLPLESRELWRLTDWLQPHGVVLQDFHYPMLMVRYRRDRFVEPVSGTRISLDADIAVPAANRRFVSASNPSALPIGVVEVKGMAIDLPRGLRALAHLGCRRRSLSKYSAAYQHVTRTSF